MNKQQNIKLLPKVFVKYTEIQAVYLFGSAATKKEHKESDIDLAVFLDEGANSDLKLNLLTDLAGNGFCNVDLVFMDTDDIVLKYEAIRLNRIIYQRPNFDRGGNYSKIIRQYLDFYPYLSVQREAYRRRITNGTTGSHTQKAE